MMKIYAPLFAPVLLVDFMHAEYKKPESPGH